MQPPDELRDTLMTRGAGGMPTGIPNEPAKIPPRMKRFETAQKMIEGYQSGWQPNPMITRILEGSK